MKIVINDNKKIHEIQSEFNDAFPFLQIQFFSKPHKPGVSSQKNLMKDTSKKLGECRNLHKTGTLSITPAMTVNELEQKFQSIFGLSIQVFRKSGKVWLQTNVTDDWTLEDQNKEGEALSSNVNKREIPERDDDPE